MFVAVLLVLGLRDDHAQLHDHSVPYANAIAAAALSAKGIANDERGYLMTGDRRFVVLLERRIRRARSAFAQAAGAADETAQRTAVVEANTGFEAWVDILRRDLATYRAGNRQRAIESALGPGRALRKRYEDSLARAQTVADTEIRADRDMVASASSRSVTILLACLLVALLMGIGVALWVMRTILRPVHTLLMLFGSAPAPPPVQR